MARNRTATKIASTNARTSSDLKVYAYSGAVFVEDAAKGQTISVGLRPSPRAFRRVTRAYNKAGAQGCRRLADVSWY